MPRKYVRKTNLETGAPETKVEVASIAGTSGEDVKKLLAEIADLKAKLAGEVTKRTKAEQDVLDAVEAQGSGALQPAVEERPTGKHIEIQVLDKYETVGYKDDGRPILRPVFKKEKVPTYFYKIDIPPVGGLGLIINGVHMYHGTVYELDIHSLRSVKDMVGKIWKHERDIHGHDENEYGRAQVRNTAKRFGVGSPV